MPRATELKPAVPYGQYGHQVVRTADPADEASGRINSTIDRLIFQCRRKDRALHGVKQLARELVRQLGKADPKPAAP